ncbi:hypothetical protein PFJ87_07g01850 [Encephalitozoon hellem]|uniref:Uncharacterized protein n=1 Tax=Encephalitozoon hellem TaxID=27973 RepID=A0ABY8CJN6_ENCHE|nr:hypothetical protein PFJ87_07g01850 [Encephalitozoon hellem]
MLGIQLSVIFLFLGIYVTAQIVKLQANEGNTAKEMLCNCRIDDQRCKDSCLKAYVPGNRISRAIGTLETKKPSVVTIRKILQQEERPFIRFIEKNIERNSNAQTLRNDDITARKPSIRISDSDSNTIFYNGSSYKICDLYSQANRIRGAKEQPSINDDMKILYEYVLNNPRIEGICTKSPVEYSTPHMDAMDNTSFFSSAPSRIPIDHSEPIILERNNMIPIFIKETFEPASEEGLNASKRDSIGSVSIITLKTTSITTTTTTAKVEKQEHNEPVRKTETQTILTTRTVTRQKGSPRKRSDDTVKTILKTVFVGNSDSNRNSANFEDQEPDITSSVQSRSSRKPMADGMANTLIDIQILEKIKSLLNIPAQNSTRSASSMSSETSQSSRVSAALRTITTTVERIRTTSTCKSSSAMLPTKETNNSYYDEHTRELIRSIFDMLKNSTTISESRRALPGNSTVIKEITTTVTKIASRTKGHTSAVSIIHPLEIKSPYLPTPLDPKSKEELEPSYESYEKKLDNIYQKIVANEERYKNLIEILMSTRRKERDEDSALESLKKIYELYRDGAIYEKSIASRLKEERRSKSRLMPYSIESSLDGRWKDRTHDVADANKTKTRSREDIIEEVSSLAYKGDGLWKGLEDDNTNNSESYEAMSPVLGDFESSNDREPEQHSLSPIVSFLKEPTGRKELDLERQLRKERRFKDLQHPTVASFLDTKNDMSGAHSETADGGKGTRHRTITDVVRTTVIRDFDSSMHLSAVSSIVEERVKNIERKLNEFTDKVVQIGGKLLKLRDIQDQRIVLKESTSNSESISPTISRSSIHDGSSTPAKTTANSTESLFSTASINASISQRPSSSLDAQEKSSTSYSNLSTSSVYPRTMSPEESKEQSIDKIVDKLKEKKIPDESLLVSEDTVIDDIVEKLAPLVSDIEVSSLSTVTRTQKEMSPQSVV